jgi:hypothetical protein
VKFLNIWNRLRVRVRVRVMSRFLKKKKALARVAWEILAMRPGKQIQ